jgi:thiol-disulfide isomerase/thioredoxin
MASLTESVVTPERLSQGITYQQWAEQIDRNQDKFQENYEGTTPNPADVEAIKAAIAKKGGITCLAIGEAWCPDVVRGMPVIGKLAEATGLDLKIFFRDQNIDIMNEFLYKGEFQSIPTLVFFDKDMNNLGVWHERAQKAREEIPVHMSPISAKMRDESLTPEERKKYMDEYAAFQSGPMWASWRDAEITEIRQMLESAAK